MFVFLISILLKSLYFTLRVSGISSFPKPLSAAEEQRLLTLVAQGDTGARNLLVEHNMRLVAHVIKKYYALTSDQEELFSIGTVGLIKAINSFNLDKNTKLATYAARCVENEIFMYFRSVKKIAGDISLSDPIDTDKDGNSLEINDILCDDTDLVEIVDLNEKSERLHNFVNTRLEKREREIITLRYGLNGKKPLAQREVADVFNISRSYVSRIESKALAKLKKAFDGK